MFSKTGVYPLDTVRKRLQVQGPSRTHYVIPSVPMHAHGTLKTIVEIVRREGLLALYKGLGPTLLKTAPATAVTFAVYGQTKELFLKFNERHHR
jgi:solute carrier family 25 thiamine pyrophosphate transporter 19